MLEFIRTHQKLMQILLMVFILPSFVFLGLEGYKSFEEKPNQLLKLDKTVITQQDFNEQFKSFIAQNKQEQGENFNIETVNTPENRNYMLNQMAEGILLQKETASLNLNIDDNAVLKYINEMPALDSIRNKDGSIDAVKFNELLQQQGLSAEQFQAKIKYLLTQQYLAENIAKSSILPANIQSFVSNGLSEKREVQIINVPASSFSNKAIVNDDVIYRYYARHAKDFFDPEKVDLEYILLNKKDIAASPISEEKIQKYYNDNIDQYKGLEERKASHILIKAEENASPETKEQAKKTAQEILDLVKQNPAQFADIAKKKSEDVGSAEKGGDLGFFAKGAMVKQFEDSAFAMKKGEISSLIQTSFGFHIIKLDDIKPSTIKPIEQVREIILQTLSQQAIDVAFNKKLDELNNSALDSKNLENIAKKVGLPLKNASNIYKVLPENMDIQATSEPALSDKRATLAIFNSEVTSLKRNTDVVQFGEYALLAHVKKHYPKRQKNLNEAKEDVRKKALVDEALKLAKQDGVSKLASLRRGQNAESWSAIQTISRTDNKMPKDILETIFAADSAVLPSYIGVPTAMGYILFKVSKIIPEKPTDNIIKIVSNFSNAYANQEIQSFLSDIKLKSNIKYIKQPENDMASLNTH
jgi:peptidyl-prolyl cis-trans isomerase D